MRETARKWGKRLLWVLPALLVVYVLVHLADYVWFRVRTPTSFQTANWSGSWRTEQHGGLSGRLLVRLPHPLPADEAFDAEAVVYYPIYSGWRTGQFVRMDFKGHFSPDDSASSGKTTRTIPGGGGKLTNWIPNGSGKPDGGVRRADRPQPHADGRRLSVAGPVRLWHLRDQRRLSNDTGFKPPLTGG